MGIFGAGKKNGKRRPMPKVRLSRAHGASSEQLLMPRAPGSARKRWAEPGRFIRHPAEVVPWTQANPEDWTREDVQQWLGHMGFERYAEPFRAIAVRLGSNTKGFLRHRGHSAPVT
jgi:SAM domain (Sterile alpha motif)